MALSGCGEIQSRNQPLVLNDQPTETDTVNEDSNKNKEGAPTPSSEAKQIEKLIDLYSGEGGLTREEIENITAKAGTEGASIESALEFLFSNDPDHDQRLDVEDAYTVAVEALPTLRWASGTDAISISEMSSRLAEDFLGASDTAYNGVTDVLRLYDRLWAGGNGDNKLQANEIGFAGLILGAIQRLNIREMLQRTGDTQNELTQAMILVHLNQQVFLRYPRASLDTLSDPDLSLELAQLFLRLVLVRSLVENNGGPIPPERQVEAIADLGIKAIRSSENGWERLRLRYDSTLFAGDADKNLNVLELANLWLDLLYTRKMAGALRDSMKPGAKLDQLATHWETVYPSIGATLFTVEHFGNYLIREDAYEALFNYDSKALGGDTSDGLNLGEITLALSAVRAVDFAFMMFDTNDDRLLNRQETKTLFHKLGRYDNRELDAFFALDRIDPNSSKFWTGLKLFFSSGKKKEVLEPAEFFLRAHELINP